MQETLLEFFKKTGRPHRLEEILHRFGLEKREAKAHLKALVARGLLEKKGSRYFLANRVQGPLSLHRDGYGFVRLPEGDLFVPPGYTGDAWPGDLVEAREHPDAPLAWATVVEDIPVGATSGRVKWHNSAYPDVTLPIAQITPAPTGRRSTR